MKINLIKETKVRIPVTQIKKMFEIISEEETEPGSKSTVNLIFSTAGTIKKLNSKYRQKDKVTDVLTFNIDEISEEDGIFGEIYISVSTAKDQAASYGASLSEEILRLFCHGMLHLFGYDHMNKKEEKTMKEKEELFLAGI